MSYVAAPADSLGGGLNLRDKVDAVPLSQAIDALNVEFTNSGAVKQRTGFARFTKTTPSSTAPSSTATSIESFYRTGSGSTQMVVGAGDTLYAYTTAGAQVSSTGSLTANSVWDFARFGDPGNEYVYAGNGTDHMRRWDGTSWTSLSNTQSWYVGSSSSTTSTTAAAPKASALCVTPSDNRLVAAGFTAGSNGPYGSTVNPSYVWFSDALYPERWRSTSFIQITPGDGEKIQAVIPWQNFVFIMKETKFAVYYGQSGDATPVFNYRMVETGVGLAAPRAYAITPEGVYFMARDGVYLTTGGEPEKVSNIINPIWLGHESDFYTGGVLNHAQISKCAMTWVDQKLYLSFPADTSTTNNRTLVYDTQLQWWSLYDFPAASLCSFRVSDYNELIFGSASGYSNHIMRHNLSYGVDDSGSASEQTINSHWRSGFFSFEQLSRIRGQKVWGAGKVNLGISADFERGEGILDLLNMQDSASTSWGSSTWGGGEWSKPRAFQPVVRRRTSRGTAFSITFRNNAKSQDWEVHRLQNHLAQSRRPSARQPEGTPQ